MSAVSTQRCGPSLCEGVIVCAALLAFACGEPSADRLTAGEPRPPELLELVTVSGSEAAGRVELELLLLPVVDGDVELEVMSPAGLRFASTLPSQRVKVWRGGNVHRERLQVDLSSRKPLVVRVRARLLGQDGQPTLIVDRELRFNEPAANPARERVPIVRAAPDGTRRVEYMERSEAQRRGLLGAGAPGAADVEAAPAGSTGPAAAVLGGDRAAPEGVQE